MSERMDSTKKDGPVKKTGLYKELLDEAAKALGTKLRGSKISQESEKSQHGIRSTDIEHHFDGSDTVRHNLHSKGEPLSYAVKNTKELVEKLKHYLSESESLPVEDRQVPAPEQSPTNGIGG